jgi:hypothetical protein
MSLGKDYLGPKVLVLESQCNGAHDVIPTARKFAQELRRLHGEGYDVKGVTIRGTILRNDHQVIPRCNLALVDGDLVEKPRPGQAGECQ